MNISQISHSPSKIHEYSTPPSGGRGASISTLTAQLAASMKRPTRRTLTLIDKALAWLRPFESPRATVTSQAERHDLLSMVATHRLTLSPYIDVDRIESNLRHAR